MKRKPPPQVDMFRDPPPPEKIEPPAELKGMVRNPDHESSIDAAKVVEPHKSKLQKRVLTAFEIHGAMNDQELELLPEFIREKETTVSKRRTELCQKIPRLVVYAGFRRTNPKNPACKTMVWCLPSQLAQVNPEGLGSSPNKATTMP